MTNKLSIKVKCKAPKEKQLFDIRMAKISSGSSQII